MLVAAKAGVGLRFPVTEGGRSLTVIVWRTTKSETAFDRASELATVARPGILAQNLKCIGLDPDDWDGWRAPLVEHIDEMLDK